MWTVNFPWNSAIFLTSSSLTLRRADRPAQKMKITARLPYIAADLLAQSFDRWEFDFIPQAFEETNLNFGLGRQVNRMEIQQVRLDGEQFCAKRRAIADVGDRIEALRAHSRPCDVDAVLGNQFFVARQVDGRHGVFRAVAAPASRRSQNAEWTRQKMPRPADAPIDEELANLAAGDALAAQLHLGIDLDLEAHLASEFGEHRHVTRGLMTEAEVESFMHLAGVQLFLQNAFGKLSWRHQRKIAAEGKQENGIYAGGFEQAQFFGGRREELQSRFRSQNSRGMRLKGYSNGFVPIRASARHNLAQYMRVCTVHAIEIAHADEGRAEISGNVVEGMKNLQGGLRFQLATDPWHTIH